MATTANLVVDELLRRVRDTQGSAHSRAAVLRLVSDLQRLLNFKTQAVTDTATLSTTPRRLLYDLPSEAASAGPVLEVTSGSLPLAETSLEALAGISPGWFREIGSAFEAWAQPGRTLLVLYPALTAASSVTVRYVKLLNDLTSEGQTLELPDQRLHELHMLGEAVLSASMRKVEHAAALIERLEK